MGDIDEEFRKFQEELASLEPAAATSAPPRPSTPPPPPPPPRQSSTSSRPVSTSHVVAAAPRMSVLPPFQSSTSPYVMTATAVSTPFVQQTPIFPTIQVAMPAPPPPPPPPAPARPVAESSSKKRKKGVVRTAAGQRWEDDTMADWPDNDYRIFCGDLGNECTDDNLAKAFSKYPTFARARVVRDKKTGKTKGYGFVSFLDPQDFVTAMKEMDGKYIANRPVKLRKSSWKDRNVENAKNKGLRLLR